MDKTIRNIIMSILLLLGAFSCFFFPESYKITTESASIPKVTKTIDNDSMVKFFSYVGLFLLVYSVWIWRDLLKFDQLGFIAGKATSPSDPENVSRDIKSDEDQQFMSTQKDDFLEAKKMEIINQIKNIFNANFANVSNLSTISNKLNLPKLDVERILFDMQKAGIVRKDFIPGSLNANFSLKDSWVNRAIDTYIQSINSTDETYLADYRYVNLKGIVDIDAIIETTNFQHLVELKFFSNELNKKILERGLKQLITYEQNFKTLKPLKLILLLIANHAIGQKEKVILDEYQDIQDNLIIKYYTTTDFVQ